MHHCPGLQPESPGKMGRDSSPQWNVTEALAARFCGPAMDWRPDEGERQVAQKELHRSGQQIERNVAGLIELGRTDTVYGDLYFRRAYSLWRVSRQKNFPNCGIGLSRSLPLSRTEIQFFLIGEISTQSHIVFQRQYHREIPLEGSSSMALAQGWSEALRQILSELEKDMSGMDLKTGT